MAALLRRATACSSRSCRSRMKPDYSCSHGKWRFVRVSFQEDANRMAGGVGAKITLVMSGIIWLLSFQAPAPHLQSGASGFFWFVCFF